MSIADSRLIVYADPKNGLYAIRQDLLTSRIELLPINGPLVVLFEGDHDDALEILSEMVLQDRKRGGKGVVVNFDDDDIESGLIRVGRLLENLADEAERIGLKARITALEVNDVRLERQVDRLLATTDYSRACASDLIGGTIAARAAAMVPMGNLGELITQQAMAVRTAMAALN